MSLSSALRAVVAAICLAFSFSAVSVAAGDLFDPSDPLVKRAQDESQARTEKWRERRNSAAEKSRRYDSRRLHRGLGRDAALSLAHDRFPEALGRDARDVVAMPNGLQFGELFSPDAAEVRSARGGRVGVMYASGAPIAVERGGELSPVRLDLERAVDGFAPSNSHAPYKLPLKAGGTARLERTGVGFHFAGAADVDGHVERNRLFFAGAGTDVDYILAPKSDGAEALWQVRSEDAPEVLRLKFDLPAGARLEMMPPPFGEPAGRDGARVVSAAGDVIAKISAPIAYDADDTSVEVETGVQGDELVMAVEHRGEDLEYPILVDPTISEVWATSVGFQGCGHSAYGTGGSWFAQSYLPNGSWSYIHDCGENDAAAGYGLYVRHQAGGWYTAGSNGQWSWWAPSGAHIVGVGWNGIRHEPPYNLNGYTSVYIGIHRDGTSTQSAAWLALTGWGNPSHHDTWQPAPSAWEQTRAVIGMGSPSTGNYWYASRVGLDGAYIVVDDRIKPTDADVKLTNIQPPLSLVDTTGDGRHETPWMNATAAPPQIAAQAKDVGLGIQEIALVSGSDTAPPGSTAYWRWRAKDQHGLDCNGSNSSMCPRSPNAATAPLTAATNAVLPEGITSVRLRATDVSGNTAYSQVPFKIKNDRTAPRIDPYGDLWNLRGQTLTSPRVSFQARAWDDAPAGQSSTLRRSGVNSITVKVDGIVKATYGSEWRNCDAYSCSIDRGFTLATDTLGDFGGEHRIRIEATDAAGNAAPPVEFSVWYYPTSTRHGGSSGTVDSTAEIASVRSEIQGQSVEVGDTTWWAVSPSDRAYIANTPGSDDVQQQCRESFHDSKDGYAWFCLGIEEGEGEGVTASASTAGGSGDPSRRISSKGEVTYWCSNHKWQCVQFFNDASGADKMYSRLWTGPWRQSEDTIANAFRHAVWVALMVNSYEANPEWAWEFGIAYEQHQYSTDDWYNNRPDVIKPSQMDVINDHVGHKIALGMLTEPGENPLTDRSACRRVFMRVRDQALYYGVDVYPRTKYEQDGYAPNYHYPIYRRNKTQTGVFVLPTDISHCDALS